MTIQQSIATAVKILQQDGLVAMPTETVYGLAANARSEAALRKIFIAKQRPIDHPLIVHIADSSELSEWAVNISPDARLLAKQFWPGPLTLILKAASGVSSLVTGNQTTIGVRVPNHPVAQALLHAFGGGLAAPSANRFGRISPTSALAVQEELGDVIDCILDGGMCSVGVESTIVDVTGETPVILRPGMITAEAIEVILQRPVGMGKKAAPRVSGALESHYAPQTPVVLVDSSRIPNFLANLSANELPLALVTWSSIECVQAGVEVIVMSKDPGLYAHDLYQMLRDLDKRALRQIVVEQVPEQAKWSAIKDRLQRASYKKCGDK